jgi:hypothetical protein
VSRLVVARSSTVSRGAARTYAVPRMSRSDGRVDVVIPVSGQRTSPRNVRASQGKVMANGHPGRPAGQCHRK